MSRAIGFIVSFCHIIIGRRYHNFHFFDTIFTNNESAFSRCQKHKWDKCLRNDRVCVLFSFWMIFSPSQTYKFWITLRANVGCHAQLAAYFHDEVLWLVFHYEWFSRISTTFKRFDRRKWICLFMFFEELEQNLISECRAQLVSS